MFKLLFLFTLYFNCICQYFEDEITFIKIKKYDDDYKSIRIKVYYKYLDPNNPNYDLYKTSIKEVKKFIQSTYKIKRMQERLILNQKICHHAKIPKKHRTKGVKNSDFILYITETYENASWIAKSSPCVYDQNYRPVAGQININNKHFPQDITKIKKFEKINTILHEFTHTLGFHKTVMERFKMTEFINETLYIKSEGIINYARQFYNCSTLTHIPLENDGGRITHFSHFEKMIFNQEIMTGSASRDTVYSKFTMLVLQDTGLYQVNLQKSGRYEWGMNQGCLATQGTCDSPTICNMDKKDRFCSYNHQHIQHCRESSKLSQCGLKTAIKDCFSKKCFNIFGTQPKAKCLKSKCTNQGIRVSHKGQVKYCQEGQSSIVLGDVEYECPEYLSFCNTYSLCNNKGQFVDGKCHCNFGFRGKKCQYVL